MADPPPAHSPATFPALETPQPVNVIHSEPASREEPQDPAAIPPPLAPLPDLVEAQLDTIMPDAVPSLIGHHPSATPTPTPVPQRTATPTRNIINGQIEPSPMPLKAAAHGAPVRRYLNEKVTGVLLEGMKRLVIEQPEDPLRFLGEYLIQKSRELESI